MSSARVQPDRPVSLLARRLIPRRRQEAQNRDIVWFQIDDLNGLFDALQAGRARRVQPERVEAARRRIRRVSAAASWSPEIYARHAWSFVVDGLDRPEDAFGPAVILLQLGTAASAEARRWLAEVPSSVRRTLEVVS